MLAFKLVAAGLIFCAGMAGGLLAARMESSAYRESATRLANAFAGGVFLGAGLLHMLTDAGVKFHEFLPDVDFPVVALVAGLGFLLMLLLDKVLLKFGHHASENFESGRVYPYVLMLALSVHSVIAGIALGLEDGLIMAITILIAVLAHKATAAMALAISFMRGNLTRSRRNRLLFMFYAMTPIGLLLGTTGAHFLDGTDESMVEGVFDALAAGTFLYIAIVNILSEEFDSGTVRMPLFVMTFLGFACMALLAVWS
jgi:zinc transporter 1/2/3